MKAMHPAMFPRWKFWPCVRTGHNQQGGRIPSRYKPQQDNRYKHSQAPATAFISWSQWSNRPNNDNVSLLELAEHRPSNDNVATVEPAGQPPEMAAMIIRCVGRAG